MQVPLWIWLATAAGIVALLALSFFTHIRDAHEPSLKEAGAWTAFFVSLSILFGLGLTAIWGRDRGIEFFAGYITEYSLSIDNLFVFVIIMSSFAVPRAFQQKVLLIGIVIALVLRTIFILIGAAAIAHFSWVFYLFGLFLILTAAKLAFEKQEGDEAYEPNILDHGVRRGQHVHRDRRQAPLHAHDDGDDRDRHDRHPVRARLDSGHLRADQ